MGKRINDNLENTRKKKEGKANTIFDDVFRTIAQKMSFLLIPLINEAFGTAYKEDQEFEQLRNEHYEEFGKIITDSIICIGGHKYHIECQSKKDGKMALRMFEYDFAIAMEYSSDVKGEIPEVDFPESCVLYIRNHRDMPERHKVKLRFANGQAVIYETRIIMAQDYTVDKIFEKNLLILLPYHILRYEHFLETGSNNKKKIDELLQDYQKIGQKLLEMEDASQLYVDLINLINQIADYVIPKGNQIRERIGAMGGRVLQLESERLEKKGRTQGIKEGRILEVYSMIADGDLTPERGAQRLAIAVPELRKRMQKEGYQFPET